MGNYGWPQIKVYITLQILETPFHKKCLEFGLKWKCIQLTAKSFMLSKKIQAQHRFINLPTTEAVLQNIVMAGQVRILGMNKNEQKLQLAPPHQTRLSHSVLGSLMVGPDYMVYTLVKTRV